MDEIDSNMHELLNRIKSCQLCAEKLPHQPNPVVRASDESKILIIGQAPGRKVHESGVPWDDASGDRLREWLGVDSDCFYDSQNFAIMPMGFCFPGTGKSGDLPPMKVCAPQWHRPLLARMPSIKLTLLIGQYASKKYLPENRLNLTETVKQFDYWLPERLVLPHPSPRNNIWLKKNPWFVSDVLPQLRALTQQVLK